MDWSEEERRRFEEETEEMEIEKENMEVFWEKLLEKIREKIRIKRIRVNKEGRERWWNGECRMKKKEVRKIFKKWRKGRSIKQ